jgi:hypothetical protein
MTRLVKKWERKNILGRKRECEEKRPSTLHDRARVTPK